MNTKFVYILKLQGGKYYVGSTENVEQRLDEHFNGLGSEWTATYRPEKLLKVYENCSFDDETYHTLRYMRQYGKENVRGGAFSSVALPSSRQEIRKMLQRHRNDACFNCGSQGHYAADCEFEVGDEVFTQENPFYGLYNKYSREAPAPPVPDPVNCGRCGRCGRNHPTNACYASFDTRGRDLRNSCFRCGSTSHWSSMCYSQRNLYGQNLFQGNYSSNNSCFHCGQSGHWASECYLRIHSLRRSRQRSIFPPKRRPLHLPLANPYPEGNHDRLDYDDDDSDDDDSDDDGYDDYDYDGDY